ncbi:copper resistance protein NlpE [Flavobacterium antarcticum]|uniref:copper resistance protein NlpE n=1 Tax=Flavobacterium antarcticum TaxID=271155 RepID=UPI0003B45C0F|nr:copper resistance protein NlpE N-terminal domain-containing protein [Flavobacterium antarcticum]
MKKVALFIIALSSSVFISCKEEAKTDGDFNEQKEIVNEEQNMDGHTSINSLDWQGTYEGTLPCDGCDGTFTELTISTDNKFILHSTKMNGDKKDKTSEEGLYQWDESGSNISMEIKGVTTMYKVGENKLILLNNEGNMMPETDKENYFLMKKEVANK